MGCIYKRGLIWWLEYWRGGQRFRESSRSTLKDDAVALLRRREGQLGIGIIRERSAARLLEHEGYFVLPTRSNLPLIDLLAIKCCPPAATSASDDSSATSQTILPLTLTHLDLQASVRLIQVRVGSGLTTEEREKLERLGDTMPRGVSIELWRYHRVNPMPEVEIIGGA